MANEIRFGCYTCVRCEKDYFVNDGTWRSCSPQFCHDCIEHLKDLARQDKPLPEDVCKVSLLGEDEGSRASRKGCTRCQMYRFCPVWAEA
jgi:hypothetical protein